MAKVVWIVNYYTATPEKVSNPRYLQMAHYFMKGGYKVITFNHTFKGEKIFQRRQYGEYDFVHVKSPCYVGNGLKRMYSIWKFAQPSITIVKSLKNLILYCRTYILHLTILL